MKKRTKALKSILNNKAVLSTNDQVKLQQNFADQLKDVFHGEKNLNSALPLLSAAASKEELHAAYRSHLRETKNQLKRLLHVFELLGKKVMTKTTSLQESLHFDIASNETAGSFKEEEMEPVVFNHQPDQFDLAALKAAAGVMNMKECHGV